MNRLLTRKKGKDGGDVLFRGKKGKKEATQQQDLNLDAVLPSTENFRTSLLLPNLSARFSMLREQDDPTSIMGKASDDSVLQPKRVSRLPDFGYASGLSDIAEVASFNSSFKPPFANQRTGSMASTDGSATDDGSNGSVMNRSRVREGNALFGGRQKTFKLAVNTDGEVKGQGRVYYDDAMGLSAYQRLRLEEKAPTENKGHYREDRHAKAETLPDNGALALLKFDDESSFDSSNSPSSEYQGKRATSSSSSVNSSGPSYTRASTAATSIVSQCGNSLPPSPAVVGVGVSMIAPGTAIPERSMTRSKRLHEQGLDQHLHEQQNSAISRLNSLQKQRSIPIKAKSSLPQLRSGGDRSVSAPSDHPFGTPKPSKTATKLPELNTFKFANGDKLSVAQTHNVSDFSSPISPFTDYNENKMLHSSLEPNDRGKATALGTFSKPKPFDEQQYLERQKQLQRPRQFSSQNDEKRSPDDTEKNGDFKDDHEIPLSTSLDVSFPLTSPTIPSHVQPRLSANSKETSTAVTNSSPEETVGEHVKELPERPNRNSGSCNVSSKSDSDCASVPTADSSHSLSSLENVDQQPPEPLTPRDYARFSDYSSHKVESSPFQEPNTPKSHLQRFEDNSSKDTQPAVDSPTLGPGLSGMVRQHLRNVSNVSSVYSVATMAGMAPVDSSYPMPSLSNRNTDAFVQQRLSKRWSADDLSKGYQNEPDLRSSVHSEIKEKHNSVEADEPADSADSATSELPRNSVLQKDVVTLKSEQRISHNRGGSTESQHERKAFANELITRQRQIQENLRNKTRDVNDNYSRAPSRSESRIGSRSESRLMESTSQSPSLGISAPLKAWGAIKSKGRDSTTHAGKDLPSSKMNKGFASANSSPDLGSTSTASIDKQRDHSFSSSRKSSATDEGASRLPILSNDRRPSHPRTMAGEKNSNLKQPQERALPSPRGRNPYLADRNPGQERKRGQSEGPSKVPRMRRPNDVGPNDEKRIGSSSSSSGSRPQSRAGQRAGHNIRPNGETAHGVVMNPNPLPTKPVVSTVREASPLSPPNRDSQEERWPTFKSEYPRGRSPHETKIGDKSKSGDKKPASSSLQPSSAIPIKGAGSSAVSSQGNINALSAISTNAFGLPPGSKDGFGVPAQKQPVATQTGGIAISPSSSNPSPAFSSLQTASNSAGLMKPMNGSAASNPPSTTALVPPVFPSFPTRIGNGGAPRKRSVNKYQISDPTFVSSTSTVETITLATARKNQIEFPPPLLDVERRRRQATPLVGGTTSSAPQSPMNGQLHPSGQVKGWERGPATSARPMQKLRQVLSEGHGLYGKAKQQQQLQRQTIQTHQDHSTPLPPPLPASYRPELRTSHTTGEVMGSAQTAKPIPISVAEGGMF